MNLLIILITAILANAVPIIRDLPHEPNIPPNGDSNLSEDVLHRTSNPSEIRERFYRASDPILDSHVFNLKMVARITNGIYLIQGITSGTIDSDELISELLRFGPVKSSDISAIDMSKVKSAISDMKKLSEKLVATDEVKDVEKVFDVLKEVLAAVDGIGNLTEWTDEKEYFKSEIGRLAKDGLDLTDIDSLDTAYKTWKPLYKQLSEKKPATSADDVENVKKSLQNLKTATTNLRNPGSIWQFTNFTFVADGIAPILKAEHGVDIFLAQSQYMTIQDSQRQVYTTYANPIPGILNDLVSRFADIQLVSKLGTSRREVKKRQLRHTFGLSDSPSDLSSISSDLADSWIKKVIKTEQMKTALKQLEGLAVLSKNVDTSLGGNLGGIDDLVAILKSLDDVSKEVTASESGVSLRFNCTIVTASNIKKDAFKTLNDSLADIDDKLVKLKTATDNLLQYVDTSGVIKLSDEVIAVCEKMKTDKSDYQEIWTELGTYNNLKELNGKLEKIYVLLTAINGLLTINGDAANAMKLMDSLDGYHNRLLHYSDYFKCLQDQDQLKLVFKTIDGLNRIRGWKDDTTYSKTLTDGLNIVQKVVDAKSGLEKMKTSIKELSELKTPETDAMKDLPEAATHSEVIGKAVQGLAGMADALKQEDDLKKVVNNIDLVETGKQKTTNPKDVESLNELVKLSKDITPMLKSLTTFSTSLSEFSKSDSLAVQSDIFSSAKQVSGVTGTFSSMVKAVGELKKISSPPDAAELTKVEEGLKTMDTLDLNFAGFHQSFDDSKKSLTALDLFFAKTWKKFQPTTPIPAQRPTLGLETSTGDVVGSGAQSAAEKDEEKKEDNDDLKYAGGIVAFLVVTLAIVFFLLYKFQRPWLMKRLPCLCWKKEKKKEKQEDEKPSEPPLPPEPPLIGPILPPIGYFFKLFVVPIFEQFEVMKTKKFLDTINVDYMLYEYLEVRHDDARVKAFDEEIFDTEWTECLKEPPFTATHYHYTGWLRGTYPANLGPLKKIFRRLATDSTPAIIHCSDGQERTGMFALAGLMKHRIKMSMNELDIQQCMFDVMSTRVNALQDHQDVAYSVHLCMELLADNEILPAVLHIDYDKMKGAWDRYLVESDKRGVKKGLLLLEEVFSDNSVDEDRSRKYKIKKPPTVEEKKEDLLHKMREKNERKKAEVGRREDAIKEERQKKWDEEQAAKKLKETKK
ncbi:hypothetical protein CRE_08462 [Caenorhabditis remanei]|uniref:Tyrosine-protein phosphatase domain-containing protein n=1 Tax=Caenorhabditis remanei TaxID=31234 RepID=E3N013_CAERE|nr:hypothetical protein CRE_08462 [Caenorhabditis remanei]